MRRLLPLALLLALIPASNAQAAFGFLPGEEGFAAKVIADGGAPATAAGSHPYRLDFHLGFNHDGDGYPEADVRDLSLELPPGLILNPNVVPKCDALAFNSPRTSPFEASKSGESCPAASQLGTVEIATQADGGEPRRFGLFNLTPPPGAAAQIGAAPFGFPLVFDLALREADSYAIDLRARNVSQAIDISAIDLTLWGTPWGASHDGERGNCLNEAEPGFPWAKCSVGPPTVSKPLPYLTLPARCAAPLAFTARMDSWQQPGGEVGREAESAGQLDSCQLLHFDFTTSGFLTDKKASSPSGFNFQLENNHQTLTEPDQPAQPQARKVVVRLPQGVTVNPSVGAGLGTCSRAQLAQESAFNVPGTACPNAAKIGEFTVRSPLFEEPIGGAVYLALPDDPTTSAPGAENPFDTTVAVYLAAKLPERGIGIKLAGRVDLDPRTGDLTATFDNLPQLPYTDLNIDFKAGQRSFLITPAQCGAAVSRIEMTPWAAQLPTVEAIRSSQIETGVGAGPCPAPGPQPFAPAATAGAINSNAASYTPYFIHLSRQDTEQEITSYSLVLPKGITGRLAGIPFCPEAAIAAARGRRGVAEEGDPSCPASSQVGRTLTGYGVGSALTYAPGRIYLAGPHNGQPLSLVTINSATVGPFDLGTIVIRSAFAVDRRTAQLQIDSRSSDPIPHIISGIPLHLRDVRIHIDRYQFTHNPSSCEASALVSTLTGSGASFEDKADDSTATVSKHFQLLNCLTLGFKPKLGLRLRGGSRRAQHPSLRATFAARGPGDSNLKQIAVTMPHSLFLANSHIKEICTRAQFDQDRCPKRSEYGRAVAHTPLFDEPLRGPVYLRSSDNKLPDLVASLRSGEVRIDLQGRIGPAKRGIKAFFANVPDAPIQRFTMTLYGGRRGLLENSQDICADPPLASVKALGQNNLGRVFTTVLRGQCGGKGKDAKGKGGRG